MDLTWKGACKRLDSSVNRLDVGHNFLSQVQLKDIYDNIVVKYDLQLSSLDWNNLSEPEFFIIEAVILHKSSDRFESEELIEFLKQYLSIPEEKVWNWNSNFENIYIVKYYYGLRIIRALLTKESLISSHLWELLELISFHINSYTPWSSTINGLIAESAMKLLVTQNSKAIQAIQDFISEFINTKFNDNLLVISTNKQQQLHGGLNPRLGFGGVKRHLFEEDIRNAWKSSSKVKALSMALFIIQYAEEMLFDSNWRLLITFILNVLDDSDVLLKYQASVILDIFLERMKDHNKLNLIANSGLLVVIQEATKKCLSYLPESTQEDISNKLLRLSYKNSSILILCTSNQSLELVELISSHILPSITQLMNNNTTKTLLLVLDELENIIHNSLKTDILLSLSKVVYSLNKIITNGDLLFWDDGQEVALKVLKCQNSIFNHFIQLSDIEAFQLVSNYKFDFIGAWSILLKRSSFLEEYHREPINGRVRVNLKQLNQITQGSNNHSDVDNIVQSLSSKVPEIGNMLRIVNN
ncbi:uncharacterized protein RJT21DRAFT_17805 [Scheffersomyces amazonensis]|uniref:uncharacterized protein n=1 Tax=Scheffersomyces amazonensis TaxID=1078765 RepID=UPI00315D310C